MPRDTADALTRKNGDRVADASKNRPAVVTARHGWVGSAPGTLHAAEPKRMEGGPPRPPNTHARGIHISRGNCVTETGLNHVTLFLDRGGHRPAPRAQQPAPRPPNLPGSTRQPRGDGLVLVRPHHKMPGSRLSLSVAWSVQSEAGKERKRKPGEKEVGQLSGFWTLRWGEGLGRNPHPEHRSGRRPG